MPRKLCTGRGEEEEETERREASGKKGRKSPERDGGEKREKGQREIVGEEMKGKELHPPLTDSVPEEERRGKRELGMETGLQRRIEIEEKRRRGMEEIEIMKDIGTGTERGIGTVKDTEKERGPLLHHHHHHVSKLGVTVLPLLGL